jgi:hypothetical protein
VPQQSGIKDPISRQEGLERENEAIPTPFTMLRFLPSPRKRYGRRASKHVNMAKKNNEIADLKGISRRKGNRYERLGSEYRYAPPD